MEVMKRKMNIRCHVLLSSVTSAVKMFEDSKIHVL